MRNQRNDQSSQQSIEWIQLSKVSHLNWCLICFACYSFNSINQSIKWKKERKKVQQTNQPTIYFIVICSFISIQFNSRKEKKWLKQTIKRTITKHQSFLIHLTNLINQSINHQNERVMKWDLSNFSFPTNPSSKCLNC